MILNNRYLVSVCITTYFHEKYISQAIDSVLKQKVDFSYEIIISDDGSTDNTQSIIMDYAKTYSNIKYIFNQNNIGLTKNVFQVKMAASGKYIVHLSGDDYWIDENKLQKQVDFLKSNSSYFGVATRIECRTNDKKTADFSSPNRKFCGKKFTLKDYLNGINYPTNGLMYKNIIKENESFFSLMPRLSPYIDDETDCLLYLMMGDIYILEDITVVYRRRIENKSEHNFNSINTGLDKMMKHVNLLNAIDANFDGKIDLINRYKIVVGSGIFKYFRFNNYKRVVAIIQTIPKKYLDRHLIIKSILYIPQKVYEVISRR